MPSNKVSRVSKRYIITDKLTRLPNEFASRSWLVDSKVAFLYRFETCGTLLIGWTYLQTLYHIRNFSCSAAFILYYYQKCGSRELETFFKTPLDDDNIRWNTLHWMTTNNNISLFLLALHRKTKINSCNYILNTTFHFFIVT